MTDDDTRGNPFVGVHELGRVWLWVGRPQVGPEALLMVLVPGPDPDQSPPAYRPLLAPSREHAESMAPTAHRAAASLGVTPLLREYACIDVHELDVTTRREPIGNLADGGATLDDLEVEP